MLILSWLIDFSLSTLSNYIFVTYKVRKCEFVIVSLIMINISILSNWLNDQIYKSFSSDFHSWYLFIKCPHMSHFCVIFKPPNTQYKETLLAKWFPSHSPNNDMTLSFNIQPLCYHPDTYPSSMEKSWPLLT